MNVTVLSKATMLACIAATIFKVENLRYQYFLVVTSYITMETEVLMRTINQRQSAQY